ncbi:MAG: hypothetical protein KKB25_02260 [Nanoarchaeota archaeon]|nr:hypothetical protein [Nanoarchaeota archaeon]
MAVKINDSIIDSSGQIHRDERGLAWFSDPSCGLARIGKVEKAVFKPYYNAFRLDFKDVEIVKRPKYFKLNENLLMHVRCEFAKGEGVQPPFRKYDYVGVLSKVPMTRIAETSEYKDWVLHDLELKLTNPSGAYHESLAEYYLF